MSFVYSVYGLQLTANLPIPGLTQLQESGADDVQVWLQSEPPNEVIDCGSSAEPWYVSSYKDDGGEHVFTAWRLLDGSYFRFRYSDGMEFFLNCDGTMIWATWPDSLAVEDAAVYLLGPIIGFLLRLRGTVCLHASAISVGDLAVAMVGPAGAGKSTTAAAFARRGQPVLSDDVVTLSESDDTFLVQPAYPHLRLWPSSVELLYGARDVLPRLVPNDASWDKCYLSLDEEHSFRRQPQPLAAIYILGDRSDSDAAPFVEEMSAHAALMALVGNSRSNYLLDKNMRAHEFASLNRVVQTVSVRRIIPHTDPDRLTRLCEVTLDDFASLRVSAVAAS
jgi:hypothetical protein